MPTSPGRLTPLAVTKAKRPGLYADGYGLYLRVDGPGRKSWVFRYSHGEPRPSKTGKLRKPQREMGLGSILTVSLLEARAKVASNLQRQRLDGFDPIAERKAKRTAVRVAQARSITFDQCAQAYVEAHKARWKNAKHVDQWRSTIRTYLSPIFGTLPVQAVDTALVMRAIEPIWTAKPETASRIRGRIEAILNWAKTMRYREGENPARWRGHLENLLPKPSEIRTVEHHAALSFAELPGFLVRLREQEGLGARALEFAILTAARTGEVIGATWGEIKPAENLWTIPAGRMKARKEHRVPLSPAALAVIEQVRGFDDEFVFPGQRGGKPLSNMAMLKALQRMDRADLTAHGFRSTFRDWAAERTNYPNHVVEMALAHAIGDKVEKAYRRSDLFEKRRELMNEWAKYCAAPPPAEGRVVSFPNNRAMGD